MSQTHVIPRVAVVIFLIVSPLLIAQERTPLRDLLELAPQMDPSSDRTRGHQRWLEVTVSEIGEVSGAFTRGSYTIYFDAVRGEANDSADPDTPPFALDIRVMDQNHAPFMTRTAGARPIAEVWYEDQMKSQALPIDVEDRQRAFAMAPAAAAALKAYAKRHDHGRWEITQVAAMLESVTLADLQDFEDGAPSDVTTMATTYYKHTVSIMKKPAKGTPWFEHSAVLLKIYEPSGLLLTWWESCNHGACASAESMSTQCSESFSKTNVNFYFWDVMCDYFGSPFWPTPYHFCNNDTLQQYLSIKNSDTKNWGKCWSLEPYAPSCQ